MKDLRKKIAVASVFFSFGLGFASWPSRIPTFQDMLNLNDLQLGAILFTLPAGIFISLLVSGWLIAKAGSRKTIVFSTILFCMSLILIGISTSITAIVAALFVFGINSSLLNIAVNTQAVLLEKKDHRNYMPFFHGLWSIAAFLAAAIGAIAIANQIGPSLHFIVISIVCLVLSTGNFLYLVRDSNPAKDQQPFTWSADPFILRMAGIAFCSMLIEGAMYDWSGVYFKDVLNVKSNLVGTGYSSFMISMAGSRLLSSLYINKWPIANTLLLCGLVTGTGLVFALLASNLSVGILGFLLIGSGISPIVPLLYSSVGKYEKYTVSKTLAFITSIGFAGLLIGPAIIGFISELIGLKGSFFFLLVLAVVILLLSLRLLFFREKEKT
ncbi:MFS transporter [Sinomicrobium sp. M5D2P9]